MTEAITVGSRLPNINLMTPTPDGPRPVTSEDVFAGKTIALFAVPGAFTPTCSAKHLPSFKDNAAALKAKGVDQIVCISVNDVHVMGAWQKAEDAADILMLADGNGEFAKAVGLEMDGTRFGMGIRSKRYAMLVKDGVVTILNVEEPGAFGASSGDTLLGQL